MAEEILNEQNGEEANPQSTEGSTEGEPVSTEQATENPREEGSEGATENTESKPEGEEEESTEESNEGGEESTEVEAPEDFDYSKYESEFIEKGDLSKESKDELYKVFPKNLVDNYLENMKVATAHAIAQTEKKAFDAVGGEDTYSKMMEWAGTNLSKDEQDVYNNIIGGGDEQLALITIKGLKARMDASDRRPNLTQGDTNTSANEVDTFMSRKDYANAISLPEYQNSPQYRADVDAKLGRTLKNGGFKA